MRGIAHPRRMKMPWAEGANAPACGRLRMRTCLPKAQASLHFTGFALSPATNHSATNHFHPYDTLLTSDFLLLTSIFGTVLLPYRMPGSVMRLRSRTFSSLLGRHQPLFQDQLPDGLAGQQVLFGDFGRPGVPDMRIQHGDNAHAGFGICAAALFIGCNAEDAAPREGFDCIFEDFNGMEQVEGDNGHHDVEFQLAGLTCEGNRRIAAKNLEHTMSSISAMTGFTLPGMMEDPGCVEGSGFRRGRSWVPSSAASGRSLS